MEESVAQNEVLWVVAPYTLSFVYQYFAVTHGLTLFSSSFIGLDTLFPFIK
jgi:hypothetical protein